VRQWLPARSNEFRGAYREDDVILLHAADGQISSGGDASPVAASTSNHLSTANNQASESRNGRGANRAISLDRTMLIAGRMRQLDRERRARQVRFTPWVYSMMQFGSISI